MSGVVELDRPGQFVDVGVSRHVAVCRLGHLRERTRHHRAVGGWLHAPRRQIRCPSGLRTAGPVGGGAPGRLGGGPGRRRGSALRGNGDRGQFRALVRIDLAREGQRGRRLPGALRGARGEAHVQLPQGEEHVAAGSRRDRRNLARRPEREVARGGEGELRDLQPLPGHIRRLAPLRDLGQHPRGSRDGHRFGPRRRGERGTREVEGKGHVPEPDRRPDARGHRQLRRDVHRDRLRAGGKVTGVGDVRLGGPGVGRGSRSRHESRHERHRADCGDARGAPRVRGPCSHLGLPAVVSVLGTRACCGGTCRRRAAEGR